MRGLGSAFKLTRTVTYPTPPTPSLQLAVESRVTSDDLQLAVSATDDKIAAMQSAVDSALSDRFRRMQDVVHEQVGFACLGVLACIWTRDARQHRGTTCCLRRGDFYAPLLCVRVLGGQLHSFFLSAKYK